MRAQVLLGLCLCLAAGCASAGYAPTQPESPSADAPMQDQHEAQPPPAQPEAPSSYGPPPAAGAAPRVESTHDAQRYAQPPPSSTLAPGGETVELLWRELWSAEAAALDTGSSCADACRALRSMQRAAAKLCELADNDDAQQRCRVAETRVRAARERVRLACSRCDGGPSLEPSAPVEER